MDPEFIKPTTLNEQPGGSSTTGDNNSGLFTRHTDSVLCCSIDNQNRLAVSGGIDDTAFVWDLNTRHVIFECLDHKESVVAAEFSLNSTYVATGDLNGYIQVRNTTTGIKVFDYEIDEVNWILWHNTSEFVMLAGTTKGDFWMWNVNDPAAVKTFTSYGSSCTAAKLLPDGMRIIVTYQDGAIRLFDLKTRQAISKLNDPGNSEIVCLDINTTKQVLAVGCIDSSIKILTLGGMRLIGQMHCKTPADCKQAPSTQHQSDSDQVQEPMDQQDDEEEDEPDKQAAADVEVIDEYSQPVVDETNKLTGDTIQQAQSEQGEEDLDEEEDEFSDVEEQDVHESVESVLFSPCGNFLAASNNWGTSMIFDVSTQGLRCAKHTGVGITRCAWTREGNYVTGRLDGTIGIYDMNLNEISVMKAHDDQVLDLALKDNIIVTASEDKTCRVSRI